MTSPYVQLSRPVFPEEDCWSGGLSELLFLIWRQCCAPLLTAAADVVLVDLATLHKTFCHLSPPYSIYDLSTILLRFYNL